MFCHRKCNINIPLLELSLPAVASQTQSSPSRCHKSNTKTNRSSPIFSWSFSCFYYFINKILNNTCKNHCFIIIFSCSLSRVALSYVAHSRRLSCPRVEHEVQEEMNGVESNIQASRKEKEAATHLLTQCVFSAQWGSLFTLDRVLLRLCTRELAG